MAVLALRSHLRSGRLSYPLLISMLIVLAIVLICIIGPWIAPYDPTAFAVRARLQPPSLAHWFGTDEFGRDMLSRILSGGYYSLAMGFGATGLALVIGVPLGLAAAFYRGWVDDLIMRIIDLMISLPPVLVGLLILAVTSPSLTKSIISVGLVYVPIMTRLTRAVALSLLKEDFIEAAAARQESAFYVLLKEVLPNAWPAIIVEVSLRITFAILLGSALSFLGLGPQPPASEWGLLIAESRPFLERAPWLGLAPGLCLCTLLIAVNRVGEGLRDWLDPRTKGRGHG
jgi:peptide/nickel transport system permease protein